MNDALNETTIKGHEGLRLAVYKDQFGKRTVFYGFNLDASNAPVLCQRAGIDYDALCGGTPGTIPQAEAIFAMQYAMVAGQVRITIPGIDAMPDAAGAVATDMCFQLGWAGFQEFRETIAAFNSQSWAAVIMGIENSDLAKQTPSRVADNVRLLEAIGA